MNGATSEFKPGTAFKNGKMYVFTKRDVTVIRPWPPAAWRKTKTKPWRRCRTNADILLSSVLERNDGLVNDLSDSYPNLIDDLKQGQLFFDCYPFPEELKRLEYLQLLLQKHRECFSAVPKTVMEVAAKFDSRVFTLMSFMYAGGEAAVELLDSNPALGFTVATNWIWHKPAVSRPLDAARRLVRMKRHKILEWLQFPVPSKAAVSILAKYPPKLLNTEPLFYLRDAMARAHSMRALGFLPKINRGVVRIVSDPYLFPHATSRLLEEVSQNPEDDRTSKTAYLMSENIRMMQVLERDVRQHRFYSIKRLDEMHQQLANDSLCVAESVHTFPLPPFPGNDAIEPIDTPASLISEAEEQNNCVMSLAQSIALGRLYLYRVLKPERATLSIFPRNGKWIVGECKGANNIPVSPACLAKIKYWLASVQGNK